VEILLDERINLAFSDKIVLLLPRYPNNVTSSVPEDFYTVTKSRP
jgi:hypothetical protein